MFFGEIAFPVHHAHFASTFTLSSSLQV
uniref:Uncharacterized protein n=1 Tax=Rhizophora mucronata TaxID=61149 RepID=A0A2P2PWJ5_RHIMU